MNRNNPTSVGNASRVTHPSPSSSVSRSLSGGGGGGGQTGVSTSESKLGLTSLEEAEQQIALALETAAKAIQVLSRIEATETNKQEFTEHSTTFFRLIKAVQHTLKHHIAHLSSYYVLTPYHNSCYGPSKDLDISNMKLSLIESQLQSTLSFVEDYLEKNHLSLNSSNRGD